MDPLKLITKSINLTICMLEYLQVADRLFGPVDVHDYTPRTHVSRRD
jgi:hypothetical protein